MKATERDTEYKLWYPSMSLYFDVYCHNMNGSPSEYLTLPAGGASNYIYKGKPWYNMAWYGKPCRGEFSKVRLVLTDRLKILRTDTTFMTKDNPRCSLLLDGNGHKSTITGYGATKDCYVRRRPTGKFKIDLTGNIFRIPNDVTWKAIGYKPTMEMFIKSSDGKSISASCGGECGGCVPSSGEYIPLDLSGNFLRLPCIYLY